MPAKELRMKVSTILALFLLVSLPANAAEGERRTLLSGGQHRSYELYRPQNLAATSSVPLVIVLHGGFCSGAQAQTAHHWNDEAARQGFVVAYPNGTKRSWNAGGECCGPAQKQKINDLAFLTPLIETLVKDENIDPARVYLAGMSNGAAMAYRYVCEGSFPIAAIGAVSGSLSAPCITPQTTSVMAIHGATDDHVPFQGGRGASSRVNVTWISVEQTLDVFRKNCEGQAAQSNGVLTSSVAICPKGREVALITIKGAGHQWPGAQASTGKLLQSMLRIDPPSHAMDATSTLWAFFQKHRQN